MRSWGKRGIPTWDDETILTAGGQRGVYSHLRMALEKRVTLQDIARAAGVHHTTVSMALRNRPGIPAATRMRIQGIAEGMGYRPDPVLAALRSYRHSNGGTRKGFTIAFVTAFDHPDFWRSIPAYARRYAGVERRAAQLGYGVQNFWFDRARMTGRRASQILRARNIAGLIVAPTKRPAALGLEWGRFACVSLTFSLQEADMHVACNNHLDTVRLAYGKLREGGCRRIGLVMDRVSDERVRRIWSTGVLGEAALLPAARRIPSHLPESLNRDNLLRWFRRHRPDGILTIAPHLEVMTWLREAGVDIPGEVCLANLDCPEPAGEVSGVYQDPEVIGMTAVDVLAGLIQRNDLGLPEHPQSILICGSWFEGKTTRVVKAAVPRA